MTIRSRVMLLVLIALTLIFGTASAASAQRNDCPDGWQAVWSDGRRVATIDDADQLEVWNFFESESDGRVLANGIDIGMAPVANGATVILDLPEGDGPWTITATGRASVCVRGITATGSTSTTVPSDSPTATTTTSTSMPDTTTTAPPVTSSTVPKETVPPVPTTEVTTTIPSGPTTSVPPTTSTGNVVTYCEAVEPWVSADAGDWEFAIYDLGNDVPFVLVESSAGRVETLTLDPGTYRVVLVVDDVTQTDAVVTIEPCMPTPPVETPPELPATGVSLGWVAAFGTILLGAGAALEAWQRRRHRR